MVKSFLLLMFQAFSIDHDPPPTFSFFLFIDPVLIRDQLLSMLLASRDTVSVFFFSFKADHYSFTSNLITILTDCLRIDIYHILHGHSSRCYTKIAC